jgi:hypothetical protein
MDYGATRNAPFSKTGLSLTLQSDKSRKEEEEKDKEEKSIAMIESELVQSQFDYRRLLLTQNFTEIVDRITQQNEGLRGESKNGATTIKYHMKPFVSKLSYKIHSLFKRKKAAEEGDQKPEK